MSDAPPPMDANNEPTRAGDMTPPQQGQAPSELPRRGYDSGGRRMSPPPPPPPRQNQPPTPSLGNVPPPPAAQPPSYSAPPRTAGPRPPRRPTPPQTRADSGMYLPWWSLVILVATVGIGSCGLLAIVSNADFMSGFINPGDKTPEIIVVTQETFNSSSNNNANNNSAAPPGSVPTAIPIAPTEQQVFATPTTRPRSAAGCPIGVLIAVSNTGDVGLAVRNEPIQGNNITYVAAEGEQFRIIGGPETSIASDGSEIEWCHLQGALATSVDGWGSVEYMTVIDE